MPWVKKLTVDQDKEIVEKYLRGRSGNELAQEYKVSTSPIYDALRRGKEDNSTKDVGGVFR